VYRLVEFWDIFVAHGRQILTFLFPFRTPKYGVTVISFLSLSQSLQIIIYKNGATATKRKGKERNIAAAPKLMFTLS
jgi:hypothetical protein